MMKRLANVYPFMILVLPTAAVCLFRSITRVPVGLSLYAPKVMLFVPSE
jgi:hypothetical protein